LDINLFYTPSQTNSRAAEGKRTMSESATSPNYIELCADIVSAYVSNNSVQAADLPSLLNSGHCHVNCR
jgi:predicted transcriptional regulator